MGKKNCKREKPNHVWDAKHLVEIQTLSNCNAVSEKYELEIQILVRKDDYSLSLKPNIQKWIKMWSS